MERQKLRAQALADELGSLIEYAARKVLGETALTKMNLHTHSDVSTATEMPENSVIMIV